MYTEKISITYPTTFCLLSCENNIFERITSFPKNPWQDTSCHHELIEWNNYVLCYVHKYCSTHDNIQKVANVFYHYEKTIGLNDKKVW